MTESISIRCVETQAKKSLLCEEVIRTLPDWFGLSDANTAYIHDIKDREVFAADIDGVVVGLIGIRYHYGRTAELWWMGIKPEFHRQGIGTQLFDVAREQAVRNGCSFMIVNTLSERSDDEYYARTRAFYEKLGFKPFFEQNESDPVNPMMWMILEL